MGERQKWSACLDRGVSMNWQEWIALADNESIWFSYEEPGISKAEHMHDHVLRISFSDDLMPTVYELDFAPLFVEQNPGGVFQVLADESRFRCIRGDYALIWPNPETGEYDETSVDLAPECVRYFCETYGRSVTDARPRLLSHVALLQKA